MFYEAFNASRGVLSLTNTTMQNIGDTGVDLDLSDQAQLTANLSNNTLTNTGFDSVFVKTAQAAQATVAIANNPIVNSQDNGINDSATFGSTIQAANTSLLCLGLRSNQSDRPFNLTQIDTSTDQAEDTLLLTRGWLIVQVQ